MSVALNALKDRLSLRSIDRSTSFEAPCVNELRESGAWNAARKGGKRGKRKETRDVEKEDSGCTRLDSSLLVHGVKYTLVFASYAFAKPNNREERGKG